MKIIHVVEPFASGVATFIQLLTSHMPTDEHIVIHGERRDVMSSAEVKTAFSNHNVHFIRWRRVQREINPVRDARALNELIRILKMIRRTSGIDAVHLHSSKSGFIGRLACRLLGISNVIYTPNGAPFLSRSAARSFVFKCLERLGAALGGKIICCSPSEWEIYRQLGVACWNINNGVPLDSERFQPPRKNSIQELLPATNGQHKTAEKKFRIVTCGRIVDQKDPGLFNDICRYFTEFRGLEFIWIGEGPRHALLTSNNISVTGWVSNNDALKLISGADIYLSSSFFEGMPFAVLDALALQKPVLLKDCIGNKDLVSRGINGDLFSSSEEAILKILRFYTNREMLVLMGQQSLNICREQFNVVKMSASYRKIYENISLAVAQPKYG